jgi:hypothetical protein
MGNILECLPLRLGAGGNPKPRLRRWPEEGPIPAFPVRTAVLADLVMSGPQIGIAVVAATRG